MKLILKNIETKFNVFSKFPWYLRNLKKYVTKTQGIAYLEVDGKKKFAFSGAGVVTQYKPLSIQGLEITDEKFNTEILKLRPDAYKILLGKFDHLKVHKEILNAGGNHIGCLDIDDGVIYTPWEDGDTYLNPAIASYDTKLNTSSFGFLSTEILKDGAPYCAVDKGTIYITQYAQPEHLLLFNTSDLQNKTDKIKPKKVLTLDFSECSQKINNVQAGKVYKDTLYLLDDAGEKKNIYAVDIKTGKVHKNVIEIQPVDKNGKHISIEAEGFTFVEKDNELQLIMIGNYRFKKWNASIIFYTFDVKL